MSDFQRCPACREYGWFGEKSVAFGRHQCKPRWECRPEWEGNDPDAWAIVHASDAESAAEKCAERYDCEGGEYAIIGMKIRGDVIIQVRKPCDDEFERWSIEAEAVPTYRATKVETSVVSRATREDPHE